MIDPAVLDVVEGQRIVGIGYFMDFYIFNDDIRIIADIEPDPGQFSGRSDALDGYIPTVFNRDRRSASANDFTADLHDLRRCVLFPAGGPRNELIDGRDGCCRSTSPSGRSSAYSRKPDHLGICECYCKTRHHGAHKRNVYFFHNLSFL
jgi:hypothetical protein